ncbi:MAG: 50S ribosomal protein L25 [Candidatus Pacebacteria bacterium]|nr:50S ribosomal protein L25 [Candidatus Paceibacterota bacterium]MDD5620988.1 50S ribosomal protein L25 [Candidatus Paceibacterota bacterium]
MKNKQEILTLQAKTREDIKADSLPAVLYGPKTKNQILSLNQKDFEKMLAKTGETSVINLEIDGQKDKHTILIHEIQKSPITGKIIHVDLYQPDLTKKVEADVPLSITGISPAVKELGGTLIKNFSEIKVKALPMDLPHEIAIDVSKLLNIHDEIKIKDLNIPEGVEILKDINDIIVSIAPPTDVEAELKKSAEPEAGEPELIRENKEEVAETESEAEAPKKE